MAHRIISFAVGKSKAYEDTLTESVSPLVLDVLGDMGRPARFGYMILDGPGDIKFEVLNHEQEDYGDQHTAKVGEIIGFNGANVKRLRLTWVSDSAYRIALS